MKKLLIACLFVLLSSTCKLSAQALSETDFTYLKFYFSLTLEQRVSFAQIEVPTGDINNFRLISSDLKSMTQVDLINTNALNLSGVVRGIFIADDTLFTRLVDSMKVLVAHKSYLKSTNIKVLANSDSSSRFILNTYLQNCPVERVNFLATNFNKIPLEILNIMQLDLDMIFGVRTVPINGNYDTFDKVRKKWLGQIKKPK